MRIEALHNFTGEFEHEAQNAVRRGVLGTEVDREIADIVFGHSVSSMPGGQAAPGGKIRRSGRVAPNLRASPSRRRGARNPYPPTGSKNRSGGIPGADGRDRRPSAWRYRHSEPRTIRSSGSPCAKDDP